jgi:hypothetical protein
MPKKKCVCGHSEKYHYQKNGITVCGKDNCGDWNRCDIKVKNENTKFH